MKLDIAINYVCSWLFFLCQYIETYDFSVFAAISLAGKVDYR